MYLVNVLSINVVLKANSGVFSILISNIEWGHCNMYRISIVQARPGSRFLIRLHRALGIIHQHRPHHHDNRHKQAKRQGNGKIRYNFIGVIGKMLHKIHKHYTCRLSRPVRIRKVFYL